MTEYVNKRYYTFNTKVCLYELIFGNFNDQPIPYKYYIFVNGDNNDGNKNPGIPVDFALLDNKGLEDTFMTND